MCLMRGYSGLLAGTILCVCKMKQPTMHCAGKGSCCGVNRAYTDCRMQGVPAAAAGDAVIACRMLFGCYAWTFMLAGSQPMLEIRTLAAVRMTGLSLPRLCLIQISCCAFGGVADDWAQLADGRKRCTISAPQWSPPWCVLLGHPMFCWGIPCMFEGGVLDCCIMCCT